MCNNRYWNVGGIFKLHFLVDFDSPTDHAPAPPWPKSNTLSPLAPPSEDRQPPCTLSWPAASQFDMGTIIVQAESPYRELWSEQNPSLGPLSLLHPWHLHQMLQKQTLRHAVRLHNTLLRPYLNLTRMEELFLRHHTSLLYTWYFLLLYSCSIVLLWWSELNETQGSHKGSAGQTRSQQKDWVQKK